MLLERLSLYNFRAFHGRHNIDLAPESPKKPVVLVTGLNGAGKTTILEALHLVLYGKRTPSPRRNSQAYERYLKECRHRGSDASEETGVELRFSQVIEGEPVVFELRRYWSTTQTATRERFEVIANGIEDSVLRDDWGQYIEELLPTRLAPLFFFDAEKIESLANSDATAQVLSVAIHSLLGLDLVDQLHNDLELLERKQATQGAGSKLLQELEELNQKEQAARQDEKEAYEERASVKSLLDRARLVLHRKERKFEAQGGLAFERRTELEAAARDAENAVTASSHQLRELAAGYAPLLLVPQLLRRVEDQVARERRARESRLLAQLLKKRDQALLRSLEAPSESQPWVDDLKDWLARDREKRRRAGSVKEKLRVEDGTARQLEHLLASDLPKLKDQLREQLDHHRSLEQELEDASKRLAAIPEEGSLLGIRTDRDTARSEVNRLEALLTVREEGFQVAKSRATEAEKRLQVAHLRNIEERKDQSATMRLVEHSSRVRSTLGVFREKVLHRHIERIEELVLEGLRSLLRKERLVTRLEISDDNFSLRLYGPEDRPLPPEQLSAGERQLLAIAVLWGLARASRRPVPTLIDTPLGRLDSVHRQLLVDRYFPFASHQVILLSTDEEIAGPLLDRLLPKIGRSYQLEHDDNAGTSTVHPSRSAKLVAAS